MLLVFSLIGGYFYSESQISKTNNLKVTIGELKFVSRSESQISEVERSEICLTNYPIVKNYGEKSRKAEGNETQASETKCTEACRLNYPA